MKLSNSDLLSSGREFEIERMHYHKSLSMHTSHFHEHYELLYLEEGSRQLIINNFQEYTLSRGSIALLPPYTIHMTTSKSDEIHTRILINISQKLMKELEGFMSYSLSDIFSSLVLSLTPYDIGQLKYNFTRLLSISPKAPFYEATVKTALSNILLQLTYSHQERNDNIFCQSKKDIVDYTVNYIQKNYSSDISLEDIASRINISKAYLINVFKEIHHITPYVYLTNVRIINAKKLLRNNNQKISDVATSCGFNSLYAFSRAFTQLEKLSPKKYQLSCTNKNEQK